MRRNRRRARRGAAAVEMAVVLPFLVLAAFAVVDFMMLFRRAAIVTDCAYNGAIACAKLGPSANSADLDSAVANAVRLTASTEGLDLAPSWTRTSGTDSSGSAYVEVEVRCVPDGAVFGVFGSGTTPISWKLRSTTTPESQ